MNILIESMTKTYFNGFVIRCWREEENYDLNIAQKTKKEIVDHLQSLYGSGTKSTDAKEIAKHVLEMDRMNAVEVLQSPIEDGIVIYKDWP